MNIPTNVLDSYPYANVMHAGGFVRGGRPALTGIDPALVGKYVALMVNDPLIQSGCSAEMNAARFLENPVLAGKTGLSTAYTGRYKDAEVTLVSCGSGSPEAELILVEFMQYTGADTYIRVGGAGGINPRVKLGSAVIASGVVRDEGMTKEYITPAFPAVCSYEVVSAMVQAVHNSGIDYEVGIARSSDSEHVGVGRPSVRNYFQPEHAGILDYYCRAGVLYTDRESAAVVSLGALFGYRCGAVCVVTNNLMTGEEVEIPEAQEISLKVALESFDILEKMDRQKKNLQSRYWIPDIEEK